MDFTSLSLFSLTILPSSEGKEEAHPLIINREKKEKTEKEKIKNRPPSFSFRLLSLVTLLLITGIFITACSKTGNEKLTAVNLDRVTIGMKKTEVKAILGEPNRVETGQFTLLEKTTYYYESGKAKVTVTLLNDAVVSKDGSFN